jgi:hypothetical protein
MQTPSQILTAFTFDDAVEQVRAGEITATAAADQLVGKLSDRELLWLLDGDTPLRGLIALTKKMRTEASRGVALLRLGIPGIRFSDGRRGVVIGRSTAFRRTRQADTPSEFASFRTPFPRYMSTRVERRRFSSRGAADAICHEGDLRQALGLARVEREHWWRAVH